MNNVIHTKHKYFIKLLIITLMVVPQSKKKELNKRQVNNDFKFSNVHI